MDEVSLALATTDQIMAELRRRNQILFVLIVVDTNHDNHEFHMRMLCTTEQAVCWLAIAKEEVIATQ
ncbi:MAG TPA: hypothetical protein VG713_10415 [Pirellulales bacterium]|nr:hypothetical protein [Pirellulales bacterium]